MNCILNNKDFKHDICDICSQGTQVCLWEFQAENEKLICQLKWYAEKNHIQIEREMCGDEWKKFQNRSHYVCVEDGKKARETLKDICKVIKEVENGS